MGAESMDRQRNSPGRPPKFAGPSRVVTVTLPEATLASLALLDPDRARAIVKAADLAVASAGKDLDASVEMLAVTPHTAVITVPHSTVLSEVAGLNLIQILPTRYLIVLEPGMALTKVEVSLLDRLETLPPEQAQERIVLGQLLERLRSLRRSERAKTGELILVEI
jgi:hypothetical protein